MPADAKPGSGNVQQPAAASSTPKEFASDGLDRKTLPAAPPAAWQTPLPGVAKPKLLPAQCAKLGKGAPECQGGPTTDSGGVSAASESSGCPTWPVVFQFDTTLQIEYGTAIWLTANTHVVVETTNLVNLPPPYPPGTTDTVLYLLRCDDMTCTSGAVEAVNDDIAPGVFSSRIDTTTTVSAWYRYVVRAYSMDGIGQCDIATNFGQAATARVFGGALTGVSMHAKDGLLVGKNNNTVADADTPPFMVPIGMPGEKEYHDTTLFLFSTFETNCAPPFDCGKFHFSDDIWLPTSPVALSRIEIPPLDPVAWTSALAVVGSYRNMNPQGQPYTINARLLHYRRHVDQGGTWVCDDQRDLDADGLSQEIELAVGSCDSAGDAPTGGVGVVTQDCFTFGQLVNQQVNDLEPTANCPTAPPGTDINPKCWHAWDSDNDGVRDDWEVFAGIVDCDHGPQGPVRDPGKCSARGPHDEPVLGCVPGSLWCIGMATSSLSDPHPGVYDVYLRNDYLSCTGAYCAADFGAGGAANGRFQDTKLQAGQIAKLPKTWTTDPLTCWDGSNVYPCSGTGFPMGLDLPYRARMHAYNGVYGAAGIGVPDLLVEDAAYGSGGVNVVNSWFHATLPDSLRHLGFFRYTLAGYNGGGGQAASGGSSRRFVWANPVTVTGESDWVIATMSHEAGHTLSLFHPNNDRPFDDGGAPAPNGESSGKCVVDLCPTGSCQCIPEECASLCSTGCSASCTNCISDVIGNEWDSNNPAGASIMSYNWATTSGMLPKNGNLPSGSECFASGVESCGFDELRFSKGLNAQLGEGALVETAPATSAAIKLARDLRCYDETGDGQPCSPQATPLSAGGPVCDAALCRSDWNKDDLYASQGNSVAFDVSRGPFNNPDTGMCLVDTLYDIDEWRRVFARGKQGLQVPPAPVPMDATPQSEQDSLVVFAFPFNGLPHQAQTAAVNHSGFQVAVTQTATMSGGTYERNSCVLGSDCRLDACTSGADCPSGTCVQPQGICGCGTGAQCDSGVCNGYYCVDPVCSFDTCTAETVGQDCMATNPQCQDGLCSCVQDSDCKSNWCDNGVCKTTRGACGCNSSTSQDQCECEADETGVNCCNVAKAVCATGRLATIPSAGYSGARPRESAAFVDTSQLRIDESALAEYALVSGSDTLRMELDLRWDGFQGGETEQIVIDSDAFRLLLDKSSPSMTTATLVAMLKGPQPEVLASSVVVGAHRWYRIEWVTAKTTGPHHRLRVWPWDLRRSEFGVNPACDYHATAFDLSAFAAVNFGGAVSGAYHGFTGRLDNIILLSYREAVGPPTNPFGPPSGCMLAP